MGQPGVHLYSGLLESVLASGGWPTRRTLEFWTAGTDSGKLGLAYLTYTCTLVCWNRFWQVGAGLPGLHLYSGLLEPVLASGGWPTWRTLVLWSAGTGSGKWGLAYLAYTCTLVCWNRFWQLGAGLPGVNLYSSR
jgi:hypothetical protein